MTTLDTPGVDTLVARVLWERRSLELEVLQQTLAEARQSEETLARLLVHRGLIEGNQLDRLLAGALGSATPARKLGPYLLSKQIGEGGMGVVWLAKHEQTGAVVALKTLPATSDPEFQARFLREGEAQARVDEHPNVVRVHTAGCDQGYLYLVLDYAPGGDLAQRLEAQGTLPPREAATIARDLALGLAHVHAAGVLHRDLKPANVLFDEHERPRLVDFGLARLEGRTALTESGVVLGTPAYMAPEQATGDREAMGPATDVYGLGALLYTTLAGRPPFEGLTLFAILDQVLTQTPKPTGVDPGLDAICLRCLEKNPSRRYVTAEALATDLQAWLDGRASSSRPRAGAWLGGALVAVSLIGLAGYAWSKRPSSGPPKTAKLSPLQRGVAAAEAGRWKKARIYFDRAAQESPNSAEVLAWRGRALRELGRSEEAFADLKLAHAGGFARDQAAWLGTRWIERAEALVHAGQPKQAALAWRGALGVVPNSTRAKLGLAWMQIRLGEFAAARDAASAEIARDPTSAEAYLLRACARRRMPTELSQALADHNEAIKLARGWPSRAYAQRATYFYLYTEKEEKKIAQDVQAARDASPSDPLVDVIEAAESRKQGDLGRARRVLARIERDTSAPASALVSLVRGEIEVQEWKKDHDPARLKRAQEHFTRGLEIDPWCFPINAKLGWLASRSGDDKRAEAHLTRAIQVLPGSMQSTRLRATTRFLLGNRLGALEDAEALMARAESAADPAHAGHVFGTLGLPTRALRAGRAALGLSATSGDARVVVAKSLLQLGQFEEAQLALEKVLNQKHRATLRAQATRAEAMRDEAEDWAAQAQELGPTAPAKAAQILGEALNSIPTRGDWWRLRAELNLAAEDPKEAIYASSRALELEPKNAELHELRGRALRRVKDLPAAAQDLGAFLAKAPAGHPKRAEVARLLQELELAAEKAKQASGAD